METHEKNAGEGKLIWHTAFLQAMKLELSEYRDSLEFRYEYQLTSEPLRIDLLIIKKTQDLIIDKNIAHIFRANNILEYKSPDDYLSINDFLKVYAYANLYAAISPGIDLSEITLTFVESRHPRKLLNYLTDVRGYAVDETSPGIYQISGDYIPIQVIESKKLTEKENLWLKSMTYDLEKYSIGVILKEGWKRRDSEEIDAYLDIIIRANPKTFLEVQKMGYPTLEEILTEAGLLPGMIELSEAKGIKQGKEIIARNLLKMGMPIAEIAQATELPVEKVMQMGSE
jgi:hypothetical protein